MPSNSLLERLCLLDSSSPDFHDQLSNVFYTREYRQSAENLSDDDLVWLVEYLDKVRPRVAFPSLHLSQYRLSTISILQVPVSGNVYTNLNGYATPRQSYLSRALFPLRS